MKSKDRVLAYLEESGKLYVSGAEIARSLSISRSAVWKAIEALRAEGCPIDAVTNRGYRLAGGGDVLSAARIAELSGLNSSLIEVCGAIDSTNRRAKELAIAGAVHGTCVIADSQTEGSGRHARSFYSPAGGIYLSAVLRPEHLLYTDPEAVTAFAAVCACEAVEETTGLIPHIKPVNDLYLDGRKICGILTESVSDFESGEVQWIVIGIGLNFRVRIDELPEELHEKAGSLYPEGSAAVTRNQLIASLLHHLLADDITHTREDVLAAYRPRVDEGLL